MSKIPRVIHQIWFQGKHELSEKYLSFQRTWKDLPGFNYEFWDSDRIDCIVGKDKVWSDIYYSFPTMIQKIDFAKYLILYLYGGIYVDMDSFAFLDSNLRIENLLKRKKKQDLIVFTHNTPQSTVTINKFMGLYGAMIINNAVIFSSARNEKMKKIVDACISAQKRWRKNLVSVQLRCLVTTGPIVFTNCIRTIPNWKEFTLSHDIFEPYTTIELTRLSQAYKEWKRTHITLMNEYDNLMMFLQQHREMNDTIAIHVLDLSWFKNSKNNWKFRIFGSLQKTLDRLHIPIK